MGEGIQDQLIRAEQALKSDPKRAEKLYLECLEGLLDSEDEDLKGLATAFRGLSVTYRLRQAESHSRAALYLAQCFDPGHPDTANRLGQHERAFGRYNEALKVFETLVKVRGFETDALLKLGIIISNPQYEGFCPSSATQKAIEALRLCKGKDPARERTAIELTIHCLTQDESARSEPLLRELLRMAETRYRFPEDSLELQFQRWLFGAAYGRLGQIEQARALLEKARSGFFAKDIVLGYAMASMDLALVEAKSRNRLRVMRISGDLFPLLSALKRKKAALGALRLFIRGCLNDSLTRRKVLLLKHQISEALSHQDLELEPSRRLRSS